MVRPAAERFLRVRYEVASPDYLEPLRLPASSRPIERAVRLADQTALTAPLVAPRCTEFIVEWSFGKVTEDGRLIWHGLERELDLDGDGMPDPVARPYQNVQYSGADPSDPRFALPYRQTIARVREALHG